MKLIFRFSPYKETKYYTYYNYIVLRRFEEHVEHSCSTCIYNTVVQYEHYSNLNKKIFTRHKNECKLNHRTYSARIFIFKHDCVSYIDKEGLKKL